MSEKSNAGEESEPEVPLWSGQQEGEMYLTDGKGKRGEGPVPRKLYRS